MESREEEVPMTKFFDACRVHLKDAATHMEKGRALYAEAEERMRGFRGSNQPQVKSPLVFPEVPSSRSFLTSSTTDSSEPSAPIKNHPPGASGLRPLRALLRTGAG